MTVALPAKNVPSLKVGLTRVRLSEVPTLILAEWTMIADRRNPREEFIFIGGPDVAADWTMGAPLGPGDSLRGLWARPYDVWAIATIADLWLHFAAAGS